MQELEPHIKVLVSLLEEVYEMGLSNGEQNILKSLVNEQYTTSDDNWFQLLHYSVNYYQHPHETIIVPIVHVRVT